MRSGDLVVVLSKHETTHLAHWYTRPEGDQVFTLCGIVDGSGEFELTQEAATQKLSCRRCRTAGAEAMRTLLRSISDLRARLELETIRFDYLTEAMGPSK